MTGSYGSRILEQQYLEARDDLGSIAILDVFKAREYQPIQTILTIPPAQLGMMVVYNLIYFAFFSLVYLKIRTLSTGSSRVYIFGRGPLVGATSLVESHGYFK